ncbi:MAG TPA: restriction endonuclease subunit S [Chitinophagales bacterium]|nr:restriction endonuclease subunit S [Chitinophagales bacterium]HNG72562.1 restriction endonuclease subunit S [Chitinophagales bacterium]
MSKNNENKLVPKFRFPEFENYGEWKEKKFDDLCKFVRGPFGRALKKEIFVNEGYAVYEQQHAIYNDFTSFRYFISQEKYNELKRFSVLPKDIIMSCSGTMGKFAVIPENPKEGVINQALLKLTVKPDYEIGFIKTSLELPVTQNKLLSQSAGGAIKNVVEVAQIKEINLLIPERKEQQKIASCLSSLDEVITSESQKLEVLKDHKKGLLQNLLPQAGETVPKFRFKEFEDSGEWVESSVEGNCLVKGRIGYRGYTTNDLVNQGEGALVLGGKHIQNQTLDLSDPTYLSWEKYYESPEIMVEIGDIIFSQRGTLGDCAIIEEEIGPATINPSMVLLKNITCNSKFLYYILIGDRIQNEVKKSKGLGAIPMLSQKQIREFSFLIPHNLEEQQRIASCLSSLDDLITAQNQKLEALQLHKKGLLQGLFPTLSETGFTGLKDEKDSKT